MPAVVEGFAHLALATLVFVGGHLALASAPASFVWFNWEYLGAPYDELWVQMPWSAWLIVVVMPFAAIFLVTGFLTSNLTAIGGANVLESSEPAPRIFKVTRHPVLWAVALWAAAHLTVNGEVSSFLLFGGLLGLSLGGIAHIEARRRAESSDGWNRLTASTSIIPFAAAIAGRARIDFAEIGWTRIGAGIALYLALLFGHRWAIDVNPFPW